MESPKHHATSQPRLSVVIAAWTGADALRRCLDSLVPQLDPAIDEIIVARNFSLDRPLVSTRPIAADLFLSAATVPSLRAAAHAHARGHIVAFIEDHCQCAAGWSRAIIAAHRDDVAGVGGPVDLAPGGAPLDWAVYFYDYARYSPPTRSRDVSRLSGANMSWSHEFLQAIHAQIESAIVETALEAEAHRRHLRLYLSAEAEVVHSRSSAMAPAAGLAFAQGRGYAAQRVAGASPGRRLTFAAAAGLLPVLMTGRIVAATLRSGRHVLRLLLALPWLLCLVFSWSAGEAAGYLAGPGRSAERWR